MAADKKSKEVPGYVKATDLAGLLDLTKGRITQLTTEGVLVKHKTAAGERYVLVDSIHAYIRYLRKLLDDKRETGLDEKKAEADIRLKNIKAEHLELQLKELRGQLHRFEDVQAITNAMVFEVRSQILSLPGRLAVNIAPEMSPEEASVMVRKEIYDILNGLSRFEYDPVKYQDLAQERLKISLTEDEDNDGQG